MSGCSNRSPRMLTIESTTKNLRTALIQSTTNIFVPLLEPIRLAKRAYSTGVRLIFKGAAGCYLEKPQAVYCDRPQAVYCDKPQAVYSDKPQAVYSDKPQAVYCDKPQALFKHRSVRFIGDESLDFGTNLVKYTPDINVFLKLNSFREHGYRKNIVFCLFPA